MAAAQVEPVKILFRAFACRARHALQIEKGPTAESLPHLSIFAECDLWKRSPGEVEPRDWRKCESIQAVRMPMTDSLRRSVPQTRGPLPTRRRPSSRRVPGVDGAASWAIARVAPQRPHCRTPRAPE